VKPTLKHIDPMLVIGIGVRTTNHAESKKDTAKIPALWGRFFQENLSGKIPNQIQSSQTYGVYSSYESDCDGKYTVTAGKCVSRVDNLPQDLAMVNVEGGSYLVFEGKGSKPEIVINIWKEIWNYFSSKQELKRRYTTDFELYKVGGEVAIHIAVM